MKAVVATAVLLLAACQPETTPPADSPTARFVGSWNCEVTVMTITPTRYMPAGDEESFAITRFDVQGDQAVLTLNDGAQVTLRTSGANAMTWFSGTTGDTLNCVRVAG